jgi:hypothetical protein
VESKLTYLHFLRPVNQAAIHFDRNKCVKQKFEILAMLVLKRTALVMFTTQSTTMLLKPALSIKATISLPLM